MSMGRLIGVKNLLTVLESILSFCTVNCGEIRLVKKHWI